MSPSIHSKPTETQASPSASAESGYLSSQRDDDTTHTPYNLGQTHSPSTSPQHRGADTSPGCSQNTTYAHSIELNDDGLQISEAAPVSSTKDFASTPVKGGFDEPSQHGLDAHTKLLESYDHGPGCGSNKCNHGSFSPRAHMHERFNSFDSRYSFGGRYNEDVRDEIGGSSSSNMRGILGDAVVNGLFGTANKGKKMSTTQWLAKRHGVKNSRMMYVAILSNFLKAFYSVDSLGELGKADL